MISKKFHGSNGYFYIRKAIIARNFCPNRGGPKKLYYWLEIPLKKINDE